MPSRHEIRLALERDYRIALGEYERAEMPTETIIGLKALEKADRAIQARKRVLKEKMEHISYLLRLQVDAEWTPHHLSPLHPRKPRRRGSIAKAAYQVLRKADEPMKVRDISLAIASDMGIKRADSTAISRLDAAVRTSLKERVSDGVVEEVEGRPTRWRVLSRPKWEPKVAPVAYASAPLVRVGGLSNAAIRAVSANILQAQRQGGAPTPE